MGVIYNLNSLKNIFLHVFKRKVCEKLCRDIISVILNVRVNSAVLLAGMDDAA